MDRLKASNLFRVSVGILTNYLNTTVTTYHIIFICMYSRTEPTLHHYFSENSLWSALDNIHTYEGYIKLIIKIIIMLERGILIKLPYVTLETTHTHRSPRRSPEKNKDPLSQKKKKPPAHPPHRLTILITEKPPKLHLNPTTKVIHTHTHTKAW